VGHELHEGAAQDLTKLGGGAMEKLSQSVRHFHSELRVFLANWKNTIKCFACK
jgi:hypothetical protein